MPGTQPARPEGCDARSKTQAQSQHATPTRVILIDDDPVMRALVVGLLEANGEFTVVAQAASVDEATRALTQAADIVVVDHDLPDGDSSHLTQLLENLQPAARTVLLTSHPDAQGRAAKVGLDAGLCKAAATSDLVTVMRTLEPRPEARRPSEPGQ